MSRTQYPRAQRGAGFVDGTSGPAQRAPALLGPGSHAGVFFGSCKRQPTTLQRWSSSAVFFILLPFKINALVNSSSHFTCGSPAAPLQTLAAMCALLYPFPSACHG